MRRVVVHIGRVSLRGLAAAEARTFGADLRAELVRLISQPAYAVRVDTWRDVSVLRTHGLGAVRHGDPARTGVIAARSIVRGMAR